MTVLAFIYTGDNEFFVAAGDDAISATTNVQALAREFHPCYNLYPVETVELKDYNGARVT